MYLITNNLTQPQTIGEQILPAGKQIVIETADRRTRRLEDRGFISIQKIEETAFGGEQTAAAETTTVSERPQRTGSTSQSKEKERK